MTAPSRYLLPAIPEGLQGLVELALDLRSSSSYAADALWSRVDPELWALTRNPWLILQTASESRLATLAADSGFCDLIRSQLETQRKTRESTSWFQQTYPQPALSRVAYFSMEFGLSEALPIYSGGLGMLAGDHLKTASDLGVPVVGIGLLYDQGYFRQGLDAQGMQTEIYPYNDPGQLPVTQARNAAGDWLRFKLPLPGRPLWLRAWQVQVGRVVLPSR